jgi:hypothetical protein
VGLLHGEEEPSRRHMRKSRTDDEMSPYARMPGELPQY